VQKLLTIAAAAEYLGVTEHRMYQMARSGVCPATVRLGRQVRIHPEKLKEWIEAGGTSLPGGWRRDSQPGEAA
jgi:excisionase family DNA binding protein